MIEFEVAGIQVRITEADATICGVVMSRPDAVAVAKKLKLIAGANRHALKSTVNLHGLEVEIDTHGGKPWIAHAKVGGFLLTDRQLYRLYDVLIDALEGSGHEARWINDVDALMAGWTVNRLADETRKPYVSKKKNPSKMYVPIPEIDGQVELNNAGHSDTASL